MKIILLSGSTCSIPAMQFLAKQNMLQAVVSTTASNPNTMMVEQSALFLNIPHKKFSKRQLLTDFKSLLNELQPDLCLAFGYGYKVPAELFTIPKFGFYNVHFSLLPAYRGRCPVFWQLKNGETRGGITIHEMDGEYDTGRILMQKQIAIQPGENHGIYSGRLSLESVMVIAEAVQRINTLRDGELTHQVEDNLSYAPALSLNDLKINWERQSAREIEQLVNAANPDYGGAATVLRGQTIRILEVSRAELNGAGGHLPGTIVYADLNHGIFVGCNNSEYLRINVTQSSEGILSGFKLASLGVSAGERLETIADQ